MVIIVKFVVVIPSFNPSEALIKIVDELIINDVRKIIIVNDGRLKALLVLHFEI